MTLLRGITVSADKKTVTLDLENKKGFSKRVSGSPASMLSTLTKLRVKSPLVSDLRKLVQSQK